MTTYTFTVPPAVTPKTWWRVDTASGSSSPASVSSVPNGTPIYGSLWADENGVLSATTFTAPDGVSTLYLKRLTQEVAGTVVGGTTLVLSGRANVPTSGASSSATTVSQLSSTIGPLSRVVASRGGFPVADNIQAIPDYTARTTTGTHRTPHRIFYPCTDLQLTYVGWGNNGTSGSPNMQDFDSAATLQINVGLEYAGTIYRVTFGGKVTGTVDGGGSLISDPLGIDLPANALVYVRTFVVSGSTWRYNHYAVTAAGGGGGYTTTTDLTAPGSAAIADSGPQAMLVPALITGRPLTATTPPSVFLIGDSIGAGYGDGPQTVPYQGRTPSYPQLSGGGFVARALYGLAAMVNVSLPGDSVAGAKQNANHFRRFTFGNRASTMICQYGRNDVSGGNTTAGIQADLMTVWNLGVNRGQKVIQTTITPRTTSTDGWTTTGNQTLTTNEATRVAVNEWLRAGAPISTAGVAVPIGTAGALTLTSPLHPLSAVWEVAAPVEFGTNTGLWKPWDNTRTVTDGATSGGTLNSATGNFTNNDLGRLVSITTAGASGGTFYGMIMQVYSATSVGLATTPTANVTGQTVVIGDAYVLDGIHPTPYAATVMGNACDVSQVV